MKLLRDLVVLILGAWLLIGILGAMLIAATPPVDSEPPRHVLRPETRAALGDLSARMDRLEAEARCKSSARRLQAGECDGQSGKSGSPSYQSK